MILKMRYYIDEVFRTEHSLVGYQFLYENGCFVANARELIFKGSKHAEFHRLSNVGIITSKLRHVCVEHAILLYSLYTSR